MLLFVDDNPNCEWAERVFQESGEMREVARVQVDTPAGQPEWCDVAGVDENGVFKSARAVRVDDSGAGTAWLITGGNWGIRYRKAGDQKPWSLEDSTQWGEPFKVLDSSGEDIQWKR